MDSGLCTRPGTCGRRLTLTVPSSSARYKREQRPDPCRVCGSPAWWNGTRGVAQVVRAVAGMIDHITDILRPRSRCSDRACRAGSWTVYEDGGYPHRVYQLPVVASAVAEVAFAAGATFTGAATRHLCDRRTVARWFAWVGDLAEPANLVRTCARLDPQGLPPPGASRGGKPVLRAGVLLGLLDHLAHLLRSRGAPLPSDGPGLSTLLGYQLSRFGDIFFLTRSSPPLRVVFASTLS